MTGADLARRSRTRLVMGGFEPKAKRWNVPRIPDGFEFQPLPEDWNHFEILMRSAIHSMPCLETAEVKILLNGPESLTPDRNFFLGEAPELAGFDRTSFSKFVLKGRDALTVAMGYAGAEAPLTDAMIVAARYQVGIAGERFVVTAPPELG